MYPDPAVEKYLTANFLPVKIDVRQHPDLMKRFGALWTPTLLFLDPAGTERYRFEGYLPPPDFLGRLMLGRGHAAFALNDWREAEEGFQEVLDHDPDSEIAPEALYWRGVARYKASESPAALAETAAEFTKRYVESSWAKKASVWGKAS
ncbi:MAG: tetratricopeptide repeat protein [Acidobacteriota bacterium]|nr:tetratricopeptide repeat protein [Acidobacteriota bacterium]